MAGLTPRHIASAGAGALSRSVRLMALVLGAGPHRGDGWRARHGDAHCRAACRRQL